MVGFFPKTPDLAASRTACPRRLSVFEAASHVKRPSTLHCHMCSSPKPLCHKAGSTVRKRWRPHWTEVKEGNKDKHT